MNNDVAQILSILDKSGLSMAATIILAYRLIVLAVLDRTMNGSSSRKAYTSDVDVFKGIQPKI